LLSYAAVVHESFAEGQRLTIIGTALVGLRDDRVIITHRMSGLHWKSARENFRDICSNNYVDIKKMPTARLQREAQSV